MSDVTRDDLVRLCGDAAREGRPMSHYDLAIWGRRTGREVPGIEVFNEHGGFAAIAADAGLKTIRGDVAASKQDVIDMLRDAYKFAGVPLNDRVLLDWEVGTNHPGGTRAAVYRWFTTFVAACNAAGVPYEPDRFQSKVEHSRDDVVALLREVYADTGQPIDAPMLNAWAEDQGRVDDLPSMWRITRLFGSLSQACDAAVVPYGRMRRGSRRARDEATLIRLLHAAHADLGEPLTFASFTAWCEREGNTPAPTMSVFSARFGSFTAACRHAQVPHVAPTRGAPRRYTRSAVISLLQDAHRDLGEPLTIDTVQRWGSEHKRPVPSTSTFYNLFGSFPEACEAAGVPGGRTRGRRPVYSREMLVDLLQRAHRETGKPLSHASFLAWAEQAGAPTPSMSTFHNLFGTFPAACDAAGVPHGRSGDSLRDHVEEVVALRQGGATLQQIGERFGVTRERVRQILAGLDVERPDPYVAFEADKVDDVVDRLAAGVTDAKIAEEFDVPVTWVKRLVRDHSLAHHRPTRRPKMERQFTDEYLLSLIRRTAAERGEPVSTPKVEAWAKDRGLRCPSKAVWFSRFGSWSDACARAGVAAAQTRRTYERRWEDDDLLAIVADYVRDCDEAGVRPTFAGYDEWRGPDRPSAALIRVRLGGWVDLVERAKTLIDGKTAPK